MDELMAEIQVPRDESSLIMVIGVGGAGCNAVSNMWHAGVKGVTYLACNTDRKSLNINPVSNKVRLGTEGLGAGNRPERGRDAAIASEYAWKFIHDARTHDLPAIGDLRTLQQIRERRRTMKNGYGLLRKRA